MRAEVFVFETNYDAVGGAETIVDVGLERRVMLVCVAGRAADAWVNGFVVGVFVRGVHHRCEIFAAAVARVDLSGDEELIEGFAIVREALGLIEDGLVPGDAEPGQVFEDGFGEVWFRAVKVEVFDAEEKFSFGGLG